MIDSIITSFNTCVKHTFNVVAVVNKQPAAKWKQYQYQRQTDQERNEQLELLRANKATAIGIICGINGVVNIDIDAHDKDNPLSPPIPDDVPYTILSKLNINPHYQWIWRSASGKGWHIWLIVNDLPADATRLEIENHTFSNVKTIEIRAWGHYSVVPSSVAVPDEPPYVTTWSQLCASVGVTNVTKQSKTNSTNKLLHEAQEKFDFWIREVKNAKVGSRNETLNKAAYDIGRYVGAGVLDEEEVRTKLFEAVTKQRQDPLPERESLATINSGVTAGKEHAVSNTTQQNSDITTKAGVVIELAKANAEFFTNPSGKIPYVKYVTHNCKKVVSVESKQFERWLFGLYFKATKGDLLSSEHISRAVLYLSYYATEEGERKELYTRIAPDGTGGLYIDMCDDAGRAIHVTSSGWNIVDDVPVAFIRSETMREIPEPRRGGSLESFRSFLNVSDDEAWTLIKAWLTTALLPDIPYPVLVLVGEQGSAKSTMAEMLRCLIDPAYPLLRRPPRDQESIHLAANSCWVVAIDNVSTIPNWLSDDICSLVTGSGIAKRKLYTDTEEIVTYAKRPFILNGITDFIQRGDLLDRALIIDVPHIPETKRLDKNTLWENFEKQRPYFFGALLDRLVGALRERQKVHLRELPRMADFTLYAVAAEKAEYSKNWNKETSMFLRSYQAARENSKEQMFESHAIGPVLHAWLREAKLPWLGTASELLRELESKANERNDKSVKTHAWPSTPHSLRCALRRLVPALRSENYTVTFTRDRKSRYILIDKENNDNDDNNDNPPNNEPPNNPPQPPPGGGGGGSLNIEETATWEEATMHTLETVEDVNQALRSIMSSPSCGFDIETTGLDPRNDKIRLVSLATHRDVYVLDAFKTDVRLLKPIFETEQGPVLTGHNLKFDLSFMRRAGIDAPTGERLFDTWIAAKLLSAGENNIRHSLDHVAHRYLNETVDKTLQKSDWSGELTQQQLEYAARDAHVVWRLRNTLMNELTTAKLTTVSAIENKALPTVVWMEDHGVLIDTVAWNTHATTLSTELRNIEEELTNKSNKVINWRSTQQVLRLLRERGHNITNTDDDTLKPLVSKDELITLLLRHREVSKKYSAFGHSFLEYVSADGRIHPDFDQLGAVSGRMTCRKPNLQQIPRDPTYRSFFIAPENRVLIKADYSQIELRIAAEITNDARMLEAYALGEDLHTLTAKLVLGKKEVTKADRQAAKALNFGLIYGMGAERLRLYAANSYNVKLTDEQAVHFRNKFFETYKGIKEWHCSKNKGIEEVRTLAGRRRLNVEKFQEKLNTPVQGTGADGLKAALGLLWDTRILRHSAIPILAVHDEIVVECDESDAEAVKEWVVSCMVQGMKQFLTKVPVEVEAVIVKNWGGK